MSRCPWDIRRIVDHAEPHIRWVMEACFNLGTRPGPSELFALRREHVDFDGCTVRIYAIKTKTFRTVPVTPDFLERLREMRKTSKSGFIVEYEGKPLTTIQRSFNTASEKAGIPRRRLELIWACPIPCDQLNMAQVYHQAFAFFACIKNIVLAIKFL